MASMAMAACSSPSSSRPDDLPWDADALEDDTLQIIFGFFHSKYLLSVISLVCKRWHKVASLCVKSINSSDFFRMDPNSISKKILQAAFKYSSSLESLSLSSPCNLGGSQLQQLISELKKLKKFGLDTLGNNISSDELFSIISLLPPHLEYIDLHDNHSLTSKCHECLPRSSPILQDRHVIALAENYRSLTHVDLESCSDLSSDSLGSLVSSCTSIVTLCLHSHKIGWPELAYILKLGSNLQNLSVVSPLLAEYDSDGENEDSDPDSSWRRTRGRGMHIPARRRTGNRNFFQQSSQSTFSDASYYSSVPDTFPSSPFFPVPPALRCLKLFTSPHKSVPWESNFFAPFLRNIGCNLNALIAHRCFNAAWQRITVLCPNLTCLDLTHSNLTCNLLEVEEVVLVGGLRLLPNLLQLALPSATEKIFRTLGVYCTKLLELRIQSHGSSSNSSSNSTDHREGIKDAAVRYLVEGCVNLRTLVLSRCSKISVASIRAIVFHCPKLQNLQLQGCSQLGDEIAQVLKPALHRELNILNVEKCNITEDFVMQLLSFSVEKRLNLKVLALSKPTFAYPFVNQSFQNSGIRSIVSTKTRMGITRPAIPWDGFQFSDVIMVDFPATIQI